MKKPEAMNCGEKSPKLPKQKTGSPRSGDKLRQAVDRVKAGKNMK